ncbi:hypothetical protein P9112_005522 [Eukaryota sp. TZLM1-RC]
MVHPRRAELLARLFLMQRGLLPRPIFKSSPPKKPKQPDLPRVNGRKPSQCSHCKSLAHNRSKCPSLNVDIPKIKENGRKAIQCSHCRAYGHNRRHCSELKKLAEQRKREQEGTALSTATGKKQITCGHCKQVGHNRRRCPLLQGSGF